MRKIVKKIATVVAAVSMTAAMSINAFAFDTLTLVGIANLFGQLETEENSKTVGWVPTAEEQVMTEAADVQGAYVYSTSYVKAEGFDALTDAEKLSKTEFKIVKDGDDIAWNGQMCLGMPEGVWADNQSQFRAVNIEEGEFKVYVEPTKGFVCLVQNKKAVDLVVRYHSRDEDSSNFVELTKAAIVGDGYAEADVMFDDAAYAEFVNACVVAEGGEAIKGEDETPAANADSNTADKKDDKKEDKGSNTTVIIVVVVVVVVIIAVVAVVMGKKKD